MSTRHCDRHKWFYKSKLALPTFQRRKAAKVADTDGIAMLRVVVRFGPSELPIERTSREEYRVNSFQSY